MSALLEKVTAFYMRVDFELLKIEALAAAGFMEQKATKRRSSASVCNIYARTISTGSHPRTLLMNQMASADASSWR